MNHGFGEASVFVCSDGPRGASDSGAVEKVREVVRAADLANVTLVESPTNKGLYRAVTEGVTRFVHEFGRVIVLEDDLLTSPYFLEYMNTGLERYQDCHRVLQVCGFGVRADYGGTADSFFSPLASSWGWGTWRRAWDGFLGSDIDAAYEQLRSSAELRRRFDIDGRYPLYLMLRRNLRNGGSSWAVRWQLYLLLQDGVALWPTRSLVHNIGSEGTGMHARWSRKNAGRMVTDLADRPLRTFPDHVSLDPVLWNRVADALVSCNPSWHRLLSTASRRLL